MSATCSARWYQKQVPSNLVGDVDDNVDADFDIGEPDLSVLLGPVYLPCQPVFIHHQPSVFALALFASAVT